MHRRVAAPGHEPLCDRSAVDRARPRSAAAARRADRAGRLEVRVLASTNRRPLESAVTAGAERDPRQLAPLLPSDAAPPRWSSATPVMARSRSRWHPVDRCWRFRTAATWARTPPAWTGPGSVCGSRGGSLRPATVSGRGRSVRSATARSPSTRARVGRLGRDQRRGRACGRARRAARVQRAGGLARTNSIRSIHQAPGVGLEPTTLRLTAECSAD